MMPEEKGQLAFACICVEHFKIKHHVEKGREAFAALKAGL